MPRSCYLERELPATTIARSTSIRRIPDAVDTSLAASLLRVELRDNSMPWDPETNPYRQDPGLDPRGQQLVLIPASSSLTLTQSGSASTYYGINGTGAIVFNDAPSTYMEITDFDVRYDSPFTLGGATYTRLVMSSFAPWDGTVTSSTTPVLFSVAAATARVSVGAARDSGSGVALYNGMITANSAISGSWIGGSTPQLTLDGTFYDSGSGYTFALHLVFGPSTRRPTVAIMSPPASPSPYAIECTSPGGASVAVAASYSANKPGTDGWTVRTSYAGSFPGGTGAFQLPLLTPSAPPAQLLYTANVQGMVALDTRQVRVVDTVAPTTTASFVKPVCGWGQTGYEPNPQAPSLCTQVLGNWSDTCSAASAQITRIQVIDYATNTVVETRDFMNGTTCVAAHPTYLNAAMSGADYVVDWYALDAWTNRSVARRWRGYFYQQVATPWCAAPVGVVTLADTLL
jgi:hypothetical protein